MIKRFLSAVSWPFGTTTVNAILWMTFVWPTQSAAFSKVDVTNCSVGALTVARAAASDTVDNTAAIQACIDAAGSGAGIYFPPGNYVVSNTLLVTNNNVTLYADTRGSARLWFTGCGDLIRFSRGAKQIFNGGIKSLWLQGDGHCAQTGVHLVDQSWISIEDLQIDGFANGTTGSSIGLQVNGREGFNARNIRINANRPSLVEIQIIRTWMLTTYIWKTFTPPPKVPTGMSHYWTV